MVEEKRNYRLEVENSLINVEMRNDSGWEIMEGDLLCGTNNFKVSLFRNKRSQYDDFLISAVYDAEGKKLWDFKGEDFVGRGLLVFHEESGEYVIMLEYWGEIQQVIPLLDLPNRMPTTDAEGKITFVGGRKVREVIEIKKTLSKQLEMACSFSKEEINFSRILARVEAKKRKEEELKRKLQKDQEHRLRELARRQKIQEIISRPEIRAIGPEGKRLRGIPVEEGEWQMLAPNSQVILVRNYEKDDMEVLEAFFVEKGKGGRCEKRYPTVAKALQEKQYMPVAKLFERLYFMIDEELEEALHLSEDGLENVTKAKIKQGTFIAVGNPDSEKRFRVVRTLEGAHYEEVGYLIPEGELTRHLGL